MAVFNFGGKSVDPSDADAFVKAVQESGGTFSGSIVAGNSYGVTGGIVTGDVTPGATVADDENTPTTK